MASIRVPAPEPRAFIRDNLVLAPVPGFPGIMLYTPHPGSRLRRLVGEDMAAHPPYWAYVWGGGAALVRHLETVPGLVAGQRVLDLGSGSGLVAIAAARAGAASILASELDPIGCAALALNAEANGVDLTIIEGNLLEGAPPDVDVVLVGDLFYEEGLAARTYGFLERCRQANIVVVIGDPFRRSLPVSRLVLAAEYEVPDFGEAEPRRAGVFTLA